MTRLLREHRPDRLLIEPTGLGHASGIVDVLREPSLAEYIQLDNILCLLDAREFSSERLQRSAVYASQLQLADSLILNKSDLAQEAQLQAVEAWATELFPPKQTVIRCEHGHIDAALLNQPRSSGQRDSPTFTQSDEAYTALCLRTLHALLDELHAQEGVLRIKGILRTGKEWSLIDATPDQVSLSPFSHRRESLIELIHDGRFPLDQTAFKARFEALAQTKPRLSLSD